MREDRRHVVTAVVYYYTDGSARPVRQTGSKYFSEQHYFGMLMLCKMPMERVWKGDASKCCKKNNVHVFVSLDGQQGGEGQATNLGWVKMQNSAEEGLDTATFSWALTVASLTTFLGGKLKSCDKCGLTPGGASGKVCMPIEASFIFSLCENLTKI